MGFNYKSLDKNTIQVTVDDRNFYIESCTASADMLYWLNQKLTAAQAEIAELKEIIKREVVPDIKDAEIADLKKELAYQKEIIGKSFQREHKLQSALDVAVEGLERIADKTSLQDFENQTDNKTAKFALDKIKQIRE